MASPDLIRAYALADRLHMKVADVLEMTVDEFDGWMAYLEIRKREHG